MSPIQPPAFASVVLDVDSTLCRIEGIDVLARPRGAAIASQIVRVTDRVMNGLLPIDQAYGERLDLIRPTAPDVEAVAREYERSLTPGAERCIRALRAAHVRIVLVSGGIRQAIAPLATRLGFTDDQLHAVALRFDARGDYIGYDTTSPLARANGKFEVVRELLESGGLTRRVIGVGDGATDAEMRGQVDVFGAFVGVARRESVVQAADVIIASFEELARIVLT